MVELLSGARLIFCKIKKIEKFFIWFSLQFLFIYLFIFALLSPFPYLSSETMPWQCIDSYKYFMNNYNYNQVHLKT